MEQKTESIEIEKNEPHQRFEARVNGHLAFVQYRYSDTGDFVIVHTEVPAELGGRGIGSALARAALEYARSRKLRVKVACPFISSYIAKHPGYKTLVETD